MSEQSRSERLAADLEALRALKKVSNIFDFEATGDPPDRYTLVFRGKGITRDSSSADKIEYNELHQCDIRLPYSYPERPPDIRWLTPIFHPNISFSGFIQLREVGMPWEKRILLDVVCERLWDVARMAYMNLDKATNFSAKNFFDEQKAVRLPVDHRPLRDKTAPASSNVVRYERRGESGGLSLPEPESAGDILFIGEDTPTPQMPARRPITRPRIRRSSDDDDVLFIG